jgi:V/A-type H+/Na+-transporting ATPase subunit D
MARLALNKSSLQKQRRRLANFERFLPSLDLKRRQLMMERAKASAELERAEAALEQFLDGIGERLPMLANREVDLTDLVRVSGLTHDVENVVGTRLPRLTGFEVELKSYSRLGRPQWVDGVAARLKECVALNLRVRFGRKRLEILQLAVRRITQRVNLFEKVLIPQTRASIKYIRIYLGDAERAAVVRSKVAKKKRTTDLVVG